jgi:hypothetical protein
LKIKLAAHDLSSNNNGQDNSHGLELADEESSTQIPEPDPMEDEKYQSQGQVPEAADAGFLDADVGFPDNYDVLTSLGELSWS